MKRVVTRGSDPQTLTSRIASLVGATDYGTHLNIPQGPFGQIERHFEEIPF